MPKPTMKEREKELMDYFNGIRDIFRDLYPLNKETVKIAKYRRIGDAN